MKLFKASYNDWNRSWVSIQVRIWKFHEFRENGHFWSKMSIFGQTYIFLYLFVSVYFDKKKFPRILLRLTCPENDHVIFTKWN